MMGWLGNSEYDCPECDGEGEAPCPTCRTEGPCDYCDGTGWDPDQVDIPAFKAAVRALQRKMASSGHLGGSWEGIDPAGKRWGRDAGEHGRVAVTDYLLETEDL